MSIRPLSSLPVRALLLGALGGARSMTPLAVLGAQHDRPELAGSWRGWPVFRAPLGRRLLVLAAAGELVGDKLPQTPSRLGAFPLAGRVGTGVVVGLALATTEGGDRRVLLAVLGGVGALLGSWAGASGRSALGRATGLPDPVVALAEDAIAVGGSIAVLRR